MSRHVWLSNNWPFRAALILLTVAAVGAVSAPAQAATTGVAKVAESTKVEYRAGKGRTNSVNVTRSGRVVTIDDKVTIKAGKGCKAVKGDKTRVRCTTKSTPTRVRVYLGDRNDTVVNRTDVGMTARGDSGHDKIFGGPRGDDLSGGDGSDTIKGYGGKDSILGQDGPDLADGGAGDDWVEGGFGNDTLYGGDGHDHVLGMEGNDREYGGHGNDRLDQSGSMSGSDSDLLSGGSGTDWVSYGGREKAITADADGVKGDDGAKDERDTIGTDVEEIYGGFGNDRLYGTSRRDILYGGPGKDTIYGYGGDDVLIGREGSDTLDGGAGNDVLDGDDSGLWELPAVADIMRGGSGVDTVIYSGRTKNLTVDLDGASRDDGQSGEYDTVGADVENIEGGSGHDRLTGNDSANRISGGGGNDTIRGNGGDDVITGGDGGDALYGDGGDDELSGQEDTVYDTGDRMDGGADSTPNGDLCYVLTNDTAVNCERF